MNPSRDLRALAAGALVLTVLLACFWWRDLGTAIYVGYDDPWELLKIGFFVRHPELGARVWNDQPWLHTLLNAWLCRSIAPGAWIPRLFTIASVAAMWAAVGWMGRGVPGALGLTTGFLLVAGTDTGLRLMLSTMLEPASMAWAVVAAALLCGGVAGPGPFRAALSGLVMAAALHVKFTAAITVPGMVFLVLRRYGWRGALRLLPAWMTGFGSGFVGLVWASPSFRWDWLLASHWEARHGIESGFEPPTPLEILLQVENLPWLLAGLAGLAWALRTGASPVETFALGWLAGAFAFACVARPWWYYYQYHFLVPASLLGGGFLERTLACLGAWGPGARTEARFAGSRGGRFSPPVWSCILVPATVGALWLGFGLTGTLRTLMFMGPGFTPAQPLVVQMLREQAPRIRWCYGSVEYLAELVQAGVYPPPELLVMSPKRLWSGQLNLSRLAHILESTGTELLLLHRRREPADPNFAEWLHRRYRMWESMGDAEIWILQSSGASDASVPVHSDGS